METSFSDTVEFCGKCCRKLGDNGKALRKSLKHAIREIHGEAVELEKTGCFSLCPDGGQVVASYAKGATRRLVILEPDSNPQLAVTYLLTPP